MNCTTFEQDIEFYDDIAGQNSQAKLILFLPNSEDAKDQESTESAFSKHLILISGGGFCGSNEYSAICHKLAAFGYVVATTKYFIPETEKVSDDFTWSVPKLQTSASLFESCHFSAIGEALRLLMNGEIKILKNHKFEDFVVLGHSLGGAMALAVSCKKLLDGPLSKCNFLSQQIKEEYWYKYFAGLITFEGDPDKEGWVTLPEGFFWTLISSPIRGIVFPDIDSLKVDQFVVDEMNHFSINNYHGEKQVVPGTHPRPQEDFFRTDEKSWEQGVALMAQIIKYEIQGHLDGDENAKECLQLFKEHKRIVKMSLKY
eukprot:TRINITY_DN4277_c0_g1_i1.p2 TRINITY_DN4277_c0_g1~~TRINITY_DN4277_c0_g1_i1.p2  ORF type:complete len:315 (-),score=54.21 TRINITY_DN4277_c0_g1_i1:126-1070(-)